AAAPYFSPCATALSTGLLQGEVLRPAPRRIAVATGVRRVLAARCSWLRGCVSGSTSTSLFPMGLDALWRMGCARTPLSARAGLPVAQGAAQRQLPPSSRAA